MDRLIDKKEFSFEITADRSIIREAVKGIIWTIFFHRLFGPITPMTHHFFDIPYPMANLPELDSLIDEKIDQLIKLLDSFTETSQSANSAVSPTNSRTLSSSSTTPFGSPSNRLYNESINNTVTNSPMLVATSEPNTTNAKFGQIIVQFFEKQAVKKTTWFGKNEDLKQWESWIINIRCLPTLISSFTPSSQKPLSSGDSNAESATSQFEDILIRIIETVDQNKDHIPPITTLDSSPFPYSIIIPSSNNAHWSKFIKKMISDTN